MMKDIATILNKLRTAAGFSKMEASRGSLGLLEHRSQPQAVAQAERVREWAGSDPTRWKRVRRCLLRIYAPVWERIDARDILVAWAGASLALTQARLELTRLEDLTRPLTTRERDAKGGKEADVSFWTRVVRHLDDQAPDAIAHDTEATRALVALVGEGQEAIDD